MPMRSKSSNVALINLGAGEVILDLPAEDLLPPQASLPGPACVTAQNLQLIDNIAQTRSGYASIATAPDSNPVTGLFFAVFDDGNTYPIRATRNSLDSYASSTWTDRNGAATFTGVGDTDYWDFAMVRRVGTVSPKNQVFALDGVNEVKKWIGTAGPNFADVSGSPAGGRVVVPFLGRAFIMNHLTSGNRHGSRITWSIVGDPETYTGTGSGTADIDDDPYPIGNAAVMSGGISMLKGDGYGGAAWRGTPTGIADTPLRWDALNPGQGTGILCRRTFILLSPNVAFFVGHDGLYLWDGIQALQRISEPIVRYILNNINMGALDAAHAWYKPRTQEIHMALPMGTSTVPSETWVYNRRDRRVYGPYLYGHDLTASSVYVESGALQWGDLDYPLGWSTLPYSTWSSIGGSPGAISALLADDGGNVFADTDNMADTDGGTPINCLYETPDLHADGRRVDVAPGVAKMFDANDMLTLQEVTLRYVADAATTVTITHSTDGGNTWNDVIVGDTLAASGGELKTTSYVVQRTGKRHRLRISGSPVKLHSLIYRFTYAGDERSY